MPRIKFRSRRAQRPQSKLRRTVLLVITSAIVVCALGGLIGFWLMTKNLPEPGHLSSSRAGSLVVLDKDGKIIHQLFKDRQHIQVQSDEIPDYLKQATVAIEDKDFYRHAGFDPLTIVRIPFNYIFLKCRVV